MTWYDRNDPRFRRTLNQITTNLESANETAQVGLFSFSEHYLKPCFASVENALQPAWEAVVDNCLVQCFPALGNDRRHPGRRRAGTRGRVEHSFDFYDDWEEDERDALLALDDDEFDRVVGGSGPQSSANAASAQQPGRRKIFDYGSSSTRRHVGAEESDPTAIPNSSYLGFMDKLPFKIGRKNLHYKPSAADLKDVTGATRRASFTTHTGEGSDAESEGLLSGRKRSGTLGSLETADSFSSRGDLFHSDDEEADAVALDDEFAASLNQHVSGDDASSGNFKTRKGKRPSNARKSTSRAVAAQSTRMRKNSNEVPALDMPPMPHEPDESLPTLESLRDEDLQAKLEVDMEVEKKREAAQQLAREVGLAPDPSNEEAKVDKLAFEIDEPAQTAPPLSLAELGGTAAAPDGTRADKERHQHSTDKANDRAQP